MTQHIIGDLMRTSASGRFVMLLGTIVSAAIFLFDLLLPLGVAAGVLYAVLVQLGLWGSGQKQTYGLAAIGTVLTILGYLLSDPGGAPWVVLANRALSLFVIWSTAFLVVLQSRRRAALDRTLAAHEALIEEQADALLAYKNDQDR